MMCNALCWAIQYCIHIYNIYVAVNAKPEKWTGAEVLYYKLCLYVCDIQTGVVAGAIYRL